ncbi:MAG: DUF1416 domain-containing protein [Candidatus Nanopelagicales bacterium]
MCGATAGGPDINGVDATKEAVIQGIVTKDGEPVSPAYVRLLDGSGEFTAEVPTSATGQFRFFAAAGAWTVRVLAPGSTVDRSVQAEVGAVADLTVSV